MARDFNQFRNANAKLISKNVNFFGKRWAVQDNADGYSVVDVVVTDTTQDVKLYLEGSNDITVFPVASDVSKLCKSALTSFPNIDTIFLFSATKVNIEEQTEGLGDYLSYLILLSKIYVPSALLNDYQNTYASLSNKFDIIVEDLTITIEWVGNNTLTSEEITRQLNMLESAYLNQATKLVIDSRYTDYMDTLWAYNFTEKCSALNNNIWHGTDKVDLTSKTLSGSDELLESDIDDFIATISADKLSGVTQLKFSGFSDMSVALSYDYEDLPNLEYIWLDNVRYEKLTSVNGYQRVEYIESTGTQYIDTGVKISTDTKILNIKTKVYTPNVPSSEQDIISNFSTSGPSGTTLGFYENKVYLGLPNNIYSQNYSNEQLLDIEANINVTANSAFLKINDTTYTGTVPTTRNLSGNNLCLFRVAHQVANFFTGKLYYAQVSCDNNLIFDFVPCYRKADNEIGLYDLVNGVFYTNAGTGIFTKGVNVYFNYTPTYFYSLSSLETEYDVRLNQTFYFDYNGTLPSYPDYQLTYYTDINCITSILPADLVSGTRYYVKAVYVGE